MLGEVDQITANLKSVGDNSILIRDAAVRGPSPTLIINELHSLTNDMADVTHDYNFHQVLASHVVISSVDANLTGHVRSRKQNGDR